MSSPETGLPEKIMPHLHRGSKEKPSSVKNKGRDELGEPIFNVLSAIEDVEETNRKLDLESTLKEASTAVVKRKLEGIQVAQVAKRSGMSGEVSGFATEDEKRKKMEAQPLDVSENDLKSVLPATGILELVAERGQLLKERKALGFFADKKAINLKLKELEDKIDQIKLDVQTRRKNESSKSIEQTGRNEQLVLQDRVDQIKIELSLKENELASLSNWNIFNMSRRFKLHGEIDSLKKDLYFAKKSLLEVKK